MSDNRIATARSVQIATLLLELVSVELGILAILTHLCQTARLSYTAYTIIGITLAIAAGIVTIRTRSQEAAVPDRATCWLIVALAFATAIIPLVAHRPDEDDWYYVPNVVHALAHRSESLGFEISFLYSADKPFVSLTYSTAQAYEYILSLCSAAFGIDYLDAYYSVAPVVVCLLIPIAAFLLLTRFEDDTLAAAVGTLAIIGALLLMGETHNTPGNLAFTRAFQGKTLLFTIGAPAWAAFALDLLARPRPRRWLILALLSAGLAGASATSTVLLPAMALAIFAGYCVANPAPIRDQLRKGLLLAATLTYTLGFAAAIWSHSRAYLDPRSIANAGFPKTFAASLAMYRGHQLTYLTLLLASVTICMLAMRGPRRMIFAVWLGTILVLFLNPVTADFWIATVTPNLYWRLFYALPFPTAIGIVVALAWKRLGAVSSTIRGALLAVVLALLVLPHFEPLSSSIFRYGQGDYWGTVLGAPRHKINPGLEDEARAIVSIAPAGPMLAPTFVCGVIPMISADHPQLRVREDAERVWLAMRGHPEEGEARISASSYAGGDRGSFEDFSAIVLRHQNALATIVVRRGVWKRPEVRQLVDSLHFHPIGETGAHVVLARADR